MNRRRAWMLLAVLLFTLSAVGPSSTAFAQRPFPIQFKPKGFVPRHLQYAQPGRQPSTSGHRTPAISRQAPQGQVQSANNGPNSVYRQTQHVEGAAQEPVNAVPSEEVTYDPSWESGAVYDDGMSSEVYADTWSGNPRGGSRLWGRAEYLLWWTKGMNTPALVTTSDAGTNQDQAGVLGLGTTDILFGNQKLNDASRSGGRFTLGLWLDPAEMSGIEANYFMLGDESSRFSADDDDFSILARPFFNTALNAEDSRLIAFPTLVEGQLTMDMTTSLEGAEVIYRRGASRSPWGEFDYLMGYRYAQLGDRLRIDESTTGLSGPVTGSQIALFDQFEAVNSFHGGQLGLRMLREASPGYTLELLGKFAVGGTRTRTVINGQTTTTPAGGTATTAAGGLLALPTNIGTVEENEFSTITEFGATLRHHITAYTTLSIGYTLLYWSDVARVGDLVDTSVNPSQIPPGTLSGERRPAYDFAPSDFWAQGLNFGLEFRF